jgi:S1-C subfamily serine protease
LFDPASGLKIGDRIVAVNGRGDVRNTSDLASRLRGNEAMVNVTVDRDGREIGLSLATRVMPEITQTKSIELSGLVISNQWKLDSAEFQHEGYLFIDFTRPGSAAEMTEAYSGQHLVAVNNRTFTDLDQLYNYLQSLPADSDVNLILKAASSEQPFYRQYHLVTLPRGEPRWLEAAQPADD